MSYEPEPSSVAARVIAFLSTQPAGWAVTNAELSHRLGVPASSFAGCLTSAVNAGLVHKRWHDIAGGRSTICWVLGPRVVSPAGLPDQAQDLAPQESAPVACPPAPDPPPPPADPVAAEIKAILDAQETAHPAAAAGFACALFNDGRLSRFMNAMRGSYRTGRPPRLVERYLELMQPVSDQCDRMDPSAGGYYCHILWRLQSFKRKKHGIDDDEIPF